MLWTVVLVKEVQLGRASDPGDGSCGTPAASHF